MDGWYRTLISGFWLLAVTAWGLTSQEVLVEMEPNVARCLVRKDTSYPIFHGCVDWHSAVHAHWALFRIARAVSKNTSFTQTAERSLSKSRLALEERGLRRQDSFENPYGRAWFLRLASEFELWAKASGVADPERLRPMADLVASTLLSHFDSQQPSPDSHDYENASWAFYQLHSHYRFRGDGAGLGQVQKIISDYFLTDEPGLTFADDKTEFFSLFGNWVFLVAKSQVQDVIDRFLSLHPIDPRFLAPRRVSTAHSMGLNWSRAWALSAIGRRAASAAERKVFTQAFAAHVDQGMRDHPIYENDYGSYGHWVPQFAVLAVTESME